MNTLRINRLSLASAVASLFVGVSLLPASAQAQFTVTVSGNVNWTDGQGNLHATRLDSVQIVGSNSLGTFVAGTGTCDIFGNYNITFNSVAPGISTYQLQVMPSNAAAFVSSDGTAANTYVIASPTFNLGAGNNTVNFNVPNNNDAATQSLAVADATLTTEQFAHDARGTAPPAVPSWFYSETAPTPGTYVSGGTLYISKTDSFDFDVNEHEYGHYLESLDDLSNNTIGGPHTPGITCIGLTQNPGTANARTLNKMQGTQLAWSEGLATFLAVAGQFDNPVGNNLPTKLQNVGDNYFDDFGELDGAGGTTSNNSTDLAGFDVGSQTMNGPITYTTVPGQGEGDEIVVQRILYAITNITHNFAPQRSPVQVYKDVIAAADGGTLQNLSEFNNYCMTKIATTDKQRVGYGAIYQYYGVSPAPNGVLATDPTFVASNDIVPTFTWTAGNFGANDTFQLIIWDSTDFTNRVIDTYDIPLSHGTTYTLTIAQWEAVDETPGTKEFVIIGFDTSDFGYNGSGGAPSTGGYWSNAYAFEVAPEPGMCGLLGVSVLLFRRCSRKTSV
jgi:hypothetical protein